MSCHFTIRLQPFSPFSLRPQRDERRLAETECFSRVAEVAGKGAFQGEVATSRTLRQASAPLNIQKCVKVMAFCLLFFICCTAVGVAAAFTPQSNQNSTSIANSSSTQAPSLIPLTHDSYRSSKSVKMVCEGEICHEELEDFPYSPEDATNIILNESYDIDNKAHQSLAVLARAATSLELKNVKAALDRFHATGAKDDDMIDALEYVWQVSNQRLLEDNLSDADKKAGTELFFKITDLVLVQRTNMVLYPNPVDIKNPIHMLVSKIIFYGYKCDFESAKEAYENLRDQLRKGGYSPEFMHATTHHMLQIANKRNIPMPRIAEPDKPTSIIKGASSTIPYEPFLEYFQNENEKLARGLKAANAYLEGKKKDKRMATE